MSSKAATLDPRKVKINYAGRIFTGLAKETFVNIAPQGEGNRLVKGAFDTSAWSIDPDSSAMVTITVMQTEADNDFLSERYRRQQAGLEGGQILLIKDLRGTSLLHSSDAKVVNFPEAGHGVEVENRSWEIMCASTLAYNVGGNIAI